ncbi:MAG: hypothetical protein ABIB47_00455 [Candidatus Woesearchaeota archaeon]
MPTQIKIRDRSRKATTLVRIVLEAAIGSFIGWQVADNFIHPSDIYTAENTVSAIIRYGRQYNYNTIGAIIGGVTIPAIDILYHLCFKRNKNSQSQS